MAAKTMRLAGVEGKAMARKIGFTIEALTHAVCPAGKDRAFIYDSRQPGLCLMTTRTDAKTFYFYGKVNGRPQRVRLGGFPEISVEQARKLAKVTSGDIADGADPMAKKRESRVRGKTMGDLWTAYLENAKPRKRSWKTDEYRWKKHLEKRWGGRRLADITRGDVQSLMTTIGKEHPTGANRILALLSVMFSYAILKEYTDSNPTNSIERYQESSRERFLGADELPQFMAALEDAQTMPVWRDYFKLLLLTGARRGNMLAARWDDINLARMEWRIPDKVSKNGHAMTVALTPDAMTILQARADNGSPFVFPGDGKTGHLKEPRKAWESLLKRANLKDVRLHDLRRTLGSWMASGGASLPIIGSHLGHRTPSVTAVYARLASDAVRQAVNAAASAMMAVSKTAAAVDEAKEETK